MGSAATIRDALTIGPDAMAVIYDGECIFCASYIKLMRLRAAAGDIKLIDARSNGVAATVKETLGLDLDEGMLVLYGDRIYYGADAMQILSELTSTSDTWNATMAAVFRRPWLAQLLYPALKGGRRLALVLRGRTLIHLR